jgi:hypothetical protein
MLRQLRLDPIEQRRAGQQVEEGERIGIAGMVMTLVARCSGVNRFMGPALVLLQCCTYLPLEWLVSSDQSALGLKSVPFRSDFNLPQFALAPRKNGV